MGNCQAAEAATVVIQHPGDRVETIYWSVSAHEVMTSNPGHYVALVVTSPAANSNDGKPFKQLKLLRPDDTLLIGQVYRLISFEDVLKEFDSKKSVKLGKLLKQSRGLSLDRRNVSGGARRSPDPNPSVDCPSIEMKQEVYGLGSSSSRGVGRHHGGGGGQWKPALQSISEIGI